MRYLAASMVAVNLTVSHQALCDSLPAIKDNPESRNRITFENGVLNIPK